MNRSSWPGWLQPLAVFFAYLLIAICMTYPLVTRMGAEFAGFDYGDAYENAHHMWWFNYALRHGEPVFHPTLLGFPNGIDGVSLRANLLQFFPAWLLLYFMPLPAAYNVQVLLTLALNGSAMYLLGRTVTRSSWAGFVAGAAFMTFPTLQGHLGAGHAGLIIQWPLALYVLALYQLAEVSERRWRYILLATVMFILTAWTHTLQIIYVLLPVTVFFALWMLVRKRWQALLGLLAANSAALLFLALYLLPVFQAATGTASYTEEGGAVRYSADLLSAVTPSFFHPLYSSLSYTRQVLGINLDEGAAYIGIFGGLLALLAVWKMRRARPWIALGLSAYILSLGPLLKVFDQPVSFTADGYVSYVTLPWAWLQNLPLFNLARTPGRFNFVLAVVIGILAAYGAAWLFSRLSRSSRAAAVSLALAAAIAFDYQMFFPLPTASARVPQAILDLRTREDVRAIFNIPWDNLLAAKEALYLVTQHQKPIIAGQVTRRTPVDPAMLTLLETRLSPPQLDASGVDVIIVHKRWLDTAQLDRIRAMLGSPVFEDDRFMLFEAPDSNELFGFEALFPPHEDVTDEVDSFLYAPDSGWTLMTAVLTGDEREAAITVDDQPLWRGTVAGEQTLRIPLPMWEAGYYTATLSVWPPCPTRIPLGQRCRSVGITDLQFTDYSPAPFAPPVRFERGVVLAGSHLPERAEDAREVHVWLWWQFDQAVSDTDIRFVHILDEAGQLVAQSDVTLGTHAPDSGWAEEVMLTLPETAEPGVYQVVTGWYSFPDITPFNVVEGAALGTRIAIGSIQFNTAAVR